MWQDSQERPAEETGFRQSTKGIGRVKEDVPDWLSAKLVATQNAPGPSSLRKAI